MILMIKNRILILIALSFFLFDIQLIAQTDSVEIDIIDNYVTPEIPHNFVLSFFTNEKTKSKVLIDNNYEYVVSDAFSDIHKIRIDISKLNFKEKDVPFISNC